MTDVIDELFWIATCQISIALVQLPVPCLFRSGTLHVVLFPMGVVLD